METCPTITTSITVMIAFYYIKRSLSLENRRDFCGEMLRKAKQSSLCENKNRKTNNAFLSLMQTLGGVLVHRH